MLNAVEPGTVVAIHRRVAKDESFVILRGKVGVTTHDDDGAVIGDVVLSWESGGYGWMFLGVCGVWWRRWSWGVLFLNVRRGRLWCLRWKG